jgi:hypothetical protein
VEALFVRNRALVEKKLPQGFDRLVLTPMAMPLAALAERLEAAILRHAEQGTIFQTRRSPSDPHIPVRVNPTLTVWVWETLRQAFEDDGLVYFPKEYPADQGGMTKSGAIHNKTICAFPGWSVGLVEDMPVMPTVGQAKNPGGRWQLPIGLSPREYLAMLKAPEYAGETGATLEDFITEFLVRLETTYEVSRDVSDGNALWCLGQYRRLPYAQAVPTGRWHRPVGRVRLDMHRTGNKLCARSFGAATVVRLPGS